ncbi:MAG: hypothetical protein WDZ49_07800 [Litorilinea sp.]
MQLLLQRFRWLLLRLALWLRAQFAHPSLPYLGLLSAYTLLALAPLLDPGYFYAAHDGRHNVFYLMMFDASIRDGALWPRWAMHHIQGYGYPTFILQAPIGFYVGELFVLLGAGYTLAVKLTWAVGFLVSGWGMYALVLYWLRRGDDAPSFRPLHRWAALLAGVLYVFIPYHLAGIYVRAALNDTLLFAWFPWVFLAFDRLLAAGLARGWATRLLVAALTLGGALLTHTFALLSFAPLLVSFVLCRLLLPGVLPGARPAGTADPEAGIETDPETDATPEAATNAETSAPGSALRRIGGAGLLAAGAGAAALLLIATFLLPLVTEGPHLEQDVYVEDTYNYRNHFVYAGQFFSPMWGFGFSDDAQGANDGMGFQIGLVALGLLVAAAVRLWQSAEENALRRGIMGYLLGATGVLMFLMTPTAGPIWDALPPLAVIQFPWRLLSLTAFTTAALAGLIAANLLRWRTGNVPVAGAGLPDQNEISGGAVVLATLIMLSAFGYIGANLDPVAPWREDGRAVFRFEAEHPDMIAFTEWVAEPFQASPMTATYENEAYTEAAARAGLLERLAIVAGRGEILAQSSGGSSARGVVRMDEAGTLRVHWLYFPGWRATVNGASVELRVSPPHGLLELDLPPGTHEVSIRMGATPVRTLGTLLSWSTLALLVGLAWFMRWRARRG